LGVSAWDAGAVKEITAAHKSTIYAAPDSHYILQPIVVELLGLISNSAKMFLGVLSRRIAEISGDCREGSFLFE